MNPNTNKSQLTVHFNRLKLEQLRLRLKDVGFLFLEFGIWAFEEDAFQDLINYRPQKYIKEFVIKSLTETSSEWYDTFCRGVINEGDVMNFFTGFQAEFKHELESGLIQQFRVITGENEKGYYYFEVLPPTWMTN